MKANYTINGKHSKLSDIKRQAQDDTLKEALGDYIIAKDIYRVGIKYSTLRSWRNAGKIRAKKVKSTWYYSRRDLLELIKTSG